MKTKCFPIPNICQSGLYGTCQAWMELTESNLGDLNRLGVSS